MKAEEILATRIENLEMSMVGATFKCHYCPLGDDCDEVQMQCVQRIRERCKVSAETEQVHTSYISDIIQWAKDNAKK